MKIFVFACVAIAAVSADGDADAYTIAQVRAGIPALKTAYDGQTRVITGVDYGHGLASGHLGYAGHLAAYNGFNTYSAYSPYNAHYIGKREADSEAEPKADADAYTIAQVHNGLPFADAVATGHAHNPGYVAYTSHSAPVHTYSGYLGGYNGYTTGYSGLVGYNGLNTHYIGKREAVPGHLAGYTGYNGLAGGLIGGYSGYNGLAGGLHRGYSGFNGLAGYRGHIYKREADSEAEPKADADAYTIAQVYNGLPYANAVATGHAHNPGYVAYTSHSAPVHTYKGYLGGYTGYTGYSGLAGYSGLNTHYIGKREADSDADAYTIAQVYNGLPYANAVATGHAHNPGYVAYTSHSAPVHRYIGGYTGYTGYNGFNRLAGVYHY